MTTKNLSLWLYCVIFEYLVTSKALPTLSVGKFWNHKFLLFLKEPWPYLLTLKQFRMIAYFTELHDKIHEAVSWGLCLGRCVWHGRIEKIFDGNFVLDALVQQPLTGGQRAVYQYFNLLGWTGGYIHVLNSRRNYTLWLSCRVGIFIHKTYSWQLKQTLLTYREGHFI